MKRYRFRLETVLRLRRAEQERARLALVLANLSVQQLQGEREREALRCAELLRRAEAVDRVGLLAERSDAELGASTLVALEERLANAVRDAVLAQTHWQLASNKVRALERLEERSRLEHQHALGLEEAALTDELVTQRYASERALDRCRQMTSVAAIQSWLADLNSTMSNLPSAVAESAPSGDFASVLASAQQLLAGPSAMAASTVTSLASTASSASTSTASGSGALSSAALSGQRSGASSSTSAGSSTSAPTGAQVVTEAESYLGVAYVWGGESPSGFDCSGLVQYVYAKLGVDLPRTSEEQAEVGTPVASLAEAEPGDLVFFAGSDGTASSPGHVGIYIGNGEMIDAPYTGTDVQIQAVGDPVSIRRVLPATSSTTAEQSSTLGDTLGSNAYTALFEQAGATYGVSPTLLAAVAKQESDFDPSALSSAGAEGLMQLMPSTAASLGVDPDVPAQAIDGAAQLLSSYLKEFGSVSDALAAYNAGPGAVEQHGGVPPYAQTQQYVQSILADLNSASTSSSAPSLTDTEATST